MDLMNASKISGTALSAHRMKLNVIAENLANVDTTRTEEGGPYRRKMVVFKGEGIDSFESVIQKNMKKKQVGPIELSPIEMDSDPKPDKGDGVKVDQIVRSQEDFALVYNPAHPDADPDTGYVKMPNVDHADGCLVSSTKTDSLGRTIMTFASLTSSKAFMVLASSP